MSNSEIKRSKLHANATENRKLNRSRTMFVFTSSLTVLPRSVL